MRDLPAVRTQTLAPEHLDGGASPSVDAPERRCTGGAAGADVGSAEGEQMWQRLGIDWSGVGAVVAAAVGIYIVFLLLVRIFGQRPLARMSTSDVVVVLALGAIVGRVILGTSVTVSAGAVALLVLFVLRWIVEWLSRARWGGFLVRSTPVLLMVEGVIQRDLLRYSRVSERELHGVLRGSGIRNFDEVACVVLEATGAVSVIRQGGSMQRELFEDVIGSDRIAWEGH